MADSANSNGGVAVVDETVAEERDSATAGHDFRPTLGAATIDQAEDVI